MAGKGGFESGGLHKGQPVLLSPCSQISDMHIVFSSLLSHLRVSKALSFSFKILSSGIFQVCLLKSKFSSFVSSSTLPKHNNVVFLKKCKNLES